MNDHDYDSTQNIYKSHERNYLFRNGCDPLKTSDYDEPANNHQDNTYDQVDYAYSPKYSGAGGIRKEGALQIECDLVDLTHVTDSE